MKFKNYCAKMDTLAEERPSTDRALAIEKAFGNTART
jgi:hypothetical protein